jgi:four helix bundle protein
LQSRVSTTARGRHQLQEDQAALGAADDAVHGEHVKVNVCGRRTLRGAVRDRRLDLYQVTLELISLCRPFGPILKRFNRRLGDQLTEALASTLQNLAEAMRRTGSDRAHLLTVSLGSCEEVRALLEAALAFGMLSPL